MSESNLLTRREFVQRASVGAAALASAWSYAPSVGAVGANERINIGVIGTGGIAGSHGDMLMETCQLPRLSTYLVEFDISQI